MTTPATLIAVSAVALGGACASDTEMEYSPCADTGATQPFVAEDSAGIAIRKTSCSFAMAEIGWTIDSIPDLELGGGETGPVQFERISGVAALPDRGVAVVDRGARELLYFDAHGRLLARLGGRGKGPGEFESPYLVRTPLSDSLLVFDGRLQRFNWYPVDAAVPPLIEVSHEPGIHGVRALQGIVGDRMLIEFHIFSQEMFQQPGVTREEPKFLWIGTGSEDSVLLGLFQVERLYTLMNDGGRPHSAEIPFSAYPSAAVSDKGPLITSGNEFQVLRFDTAGSLTQILRVDRRRNPVGRQDRHAYRLARSAVDGRDPEDGFPRLSDIPLPDSMPAFESLQVDQVGWLWAELFEFDSRRPSPWMVFDVDGRARGILSVPTGVTVHEIGEDYILGTWKDEFDVEYVRRYPLTRR